MRGLDGLVSIRAVVNYYLGENYFIFLWRRDAYSVSLKHAMKSDPSIIDERRLFMSGYLELPHICQFVVPGIYPMEPPSQFRTVHQSSQDFTPVLLAPIPDNNSIVNVPHLTHVPLAIHLSQLSSIPPKRPETCSAPLAAVAGKTRSQLHKVSLLLLEIMM